MSQNPEKGAYKIVTAETRNLQVNERIEIV